MPSTTRPLTLPFLAALHAVLFHAALLAATPAGAQDVDFSFLTTRAEASGYEQTTSYEEVRAFLDVLAKASDRMHQATFGYTTEGRPLPLMVYGDVADAGPEAALATGKTRVFVMANIHAGEVAGKEAALMLLRALAAGRHATWADSLVLLVAPIYNADGNERVSLYNRPLQLGPVGGMGQRPNAQGLDLNRDFMKLDSPEARSLVGLLRRYDPHVVIDLHTTNGTRHGYHLTYSPPLHPNTYAPIDSLLRTDWLPAVTEAVEEQYGWDFYYYGNVPPEESEAPRGWYTFSHRPRFGTNYAGLRNRFGILSEAYAYAPFEERILASLYFVEEVVGYAAAHASAIRRITQGADSRHVAGQTFALEADYARSEAPARILMGAVEDVPHPYTGRTMLRRLDVQRPDSMYAYGTFRPTLETAAPAAYYVMPGRAVVRDRLIAHGVRFEELQALETRTVEQFRIDSVHVAEEVYQGHRAHVLYGRYETAEVTLPEGTLVVPTDQPLGRLAFFLLEPQADDGLAHWGLLEPMPAAGEAYPIYREPSPPPAE